jgi:CheY-like chemotaxis protein
MGYNADLAANGLEVIEALDRQSYDLIFMDVQMPEMDGLEATQRVRERSGEQPRIVGLTAHAMVGDRERCLAAGMDGYLKKPVQIAELKESLESMLPQEQPFDDDALDATAPIDAKLLALFRENHSSKPD